MKNNIISITRVTATLMIILCHLFSWLNINILAMFFNVGVEIFLLISGYLYSNREISDPILFLKKRWIKLCIPMYIIFTFLLLCNCVVFQNFTTLKLIPTYLFNLQGLGFITISCQLPQLNELGQLWFLSIIMLCYVILIPIKKIESKLFWNDKTKIYCTYTIFTLICCFFSFANIQIFYILIFFIGYALGKWNTYYSTKSYILMSLLMIFSLIFRIISRQLFDGTLLYNNIIVIVTHTILAIWIYGSIQVMYNKFQPLFDRICKHKVWNWLENNSMMFYMTHYMFLIGPFNITNIKISIMAQICLFFILTIISSFFLTFISKKITLHLL